MAMACNKEYIVYQFCQLWALNVEYYSINGLKFVRAMYDWQQGSVYPVSYH